jgi:hypothetical protein
VSSAPARAPSLTPIEIALDLETPTLSDDTSLRFSGLSEPRICLVAAFALTAQLKRIVAAIDRAVPARLPSGLRITRSKNPSPSRSAGIAIVPAPALMRLQSRLVRAIQPGLVSSVAEISFRKPRNMGEHNALFIRDFISCKARPMFEPPCAPEDLATTRLVAVGITIYRLGRQGAPQSILGRWRYAQNLPNSLPLRSAP